MEKQNWFTHYDQHVPYEIRPPHKPIHLLLEEKAKQTPDKPVLVCLKKKMRYKELLHDIDKFAAALLALGVKKGDRICFLLPNLIQFPVVHFAVLKTGAVSVPVNPLFTRYEIEKILKLSQPKILIVLSKNYGKVSGLQRSTSVEKIIVSEEIDYCSLPVKIGYRIKYRKAGIASSEAGVYGFRDLIRNAGPLVSPVDISLEDTALLVATGGRTGRLKLAELSHGNLVSNAIQTKCWIPENLENTDTLLAVLPLFHTFGLTLSLHISLLEGIRIILMPLFITGKVLQAVKKYKVTYFPAVPAMFAYILEHPEAENADFSSLKFCLSGGVELDPDLQREFESKTGVRIVESYGLTEASPAVLSNPVAGKHKIRSVGIPLPSTRVKIVDPETGVPVAPGEEGELIIKGPQVMKRYWKDPEETARTLRKGWLFTGDRAKTEKEGYFYITGRYKKVIIHGGFNVFPQEVEEVLLRYPAVKKVRVTGVKDKKYGEIVKAVIVPEDGITLCKKELKDFCRNFLTGYKIPRIFGFVQEIPDCEDQTVTEEKR